MRGTLIRNQVGQITLEWGPEETRGVQQLESIGEAFALADKLKADPDDFGFQWLVESGVIDADGNPI